MRMINKQVAVPAEKATFSITFDGTCDVMADLMLCAISKEGHLLDASRIWFGRSELQLSRATLDDSYYFVGLMGDLSNTSLTTFGLFSAFGFYEVAAMFDPVIKVYRLQPIPEASWRRWICHNNESIVRTRNPYDASNTVHTKRSNPVAVFQTSGRF